VSESLYQQAVKDLAAAEPQRLASPDASAKLDNPLCGDAVTVELAFEGEHVSGFGHAVKGCLLCKAASTVAAQHVVGLERTEAATLADQVAAMLKADSPPVFSGLEPFLAVRPHKSRHGCVLLPFKAIAAALARPDV
jgi:nitrogen fixation NifU-like protein